VILQLHLVVGEMTLRCAFHLRSVLGRLVALKAELENENEKSIFHKKWPLYLLTSTTASLQNKQSHSTRCKSKQQKVQFMCGGLKLGSS